MDNYKMLMTSFCKPVIVFYYDSLQIIDTNSEGEKLFHQSVCNVKGKDIREFVRLENGGTGDLAEDKLRTHYNIHNSKINTDTGNIDCTDIVIFDTQFQGKKARLMLFAGIESVYKESGPQPQLELPLLKFAEKYPNGALFIVDNNFRIHFSGGQELEQIGFSNSNLEQKIINEVLPVKEQDLFVSFLTDLFNCKHKVYEIEMADRTFQVSGNCFQKSHDKVEKVLVVFQNITEIVKTRKEIYFSADILKNVNDAIIVKDFSGKIIYWNTVATKVFGYSADQILGRSIGILLSQNGDLDEFYKLRQMVMEQGMITIEKRLFKADGSSVMIEAKHSMVLDSQGGPSHIICVSRDISHRIEAEKVLKESEANLQAIFQSTSQSFILMDTSYRMIAFNKNARDEFKKLFMVDVTDGELYTDYLLHNRAKSFEEAMKRVMNRQMVRYEDTFNFPGQSNVYYEITYSPVLKDDKVIGVIVCAENKTDILATVKAVEKSEQKYRELVESAIDLIWTIDSSGKLVFVNQAAKAIIGWDPKEITGMNFLSFVAPDDRKRVEEDIHDALLMDKHHDNYPSKILCKNGSIIHVLTHGVVHSEKDGDSTKVYLTGTSRDISERVRAETKLNEKNQQLRMLSSYLQSVREDERTHIAREIHDELGQQLTGIKMDLSWIYKKSNNQNPEIGTKLHEVIQLVDETVKSVRKISSDLRPGILDDFGLIPAIEWQCQEFEKRNNTPCTFTKNTIDIPVSKDVATGVFRIFQEALTNISRHSGATRVKVEMTNNSYNNILRITDNGVGFSISNIVERKTLGLIGMQERASMLNGTLIFNSQPRKGTEVLLEFPLTENELSL